MNSIQSIQSYLAQLYQGRPMIVKPYAYPVTFLALAQNVNATQQLQIQANADFLITDVSFRAQIGAAQTVSTKTAPFVRMLVTDSGSNQQFTNAAIDLENYASNDAKIRMLPFPRLVQGRSALTVSVTNYSPGAGETYTSLEIVFNGVEIYLLTQAPQTSY